MARLARIVVPGVAHHVTQGGNRRQDVFFGDEDYRHYRDLVAEACGTAGMPCIAWCLMPNHVQLILTPPRSDALRVALSETHRRYSSRINIAHSWTGYLWQGRFSSYPFDEQHLAATIRHVEVDPVNAHLVENPQDWPWSSAAARMTGERDGLTDLRAASDILVGWRTLPSRSLADVSVAQDDRTVIEAHCRTGRPRGDEHFLHFAEEQSGRSLKRGKPGPRPRTQVDYVSNPTD